MPYSFKSHHERTKRATEGRSRWQSDRFYRTARWQRFRTWFLAQSPLCADPFGYHDQDGVLVPATDVDHIERLKMTPERALDPKNCQALCKRCHSMKTAQEQKG